MSAARERMLVLALREGLFVMVAAFGAVLFLQHGLLYLKGARVEASPPSAYLLVTVILYGFLRVVVVLARMRPPVVRGGLERCPECGQPLEDGTPKGLEAHLQTPKTPKPTEREVLASVALRKAIDEARRASLRDAGVYRAENLRLPGDIENAPLLPRTGMPTREPLVIKRVLKEPPPPKAPKGPD